MSDPDTRAQTGTGRSVRRSRRIAGLVRAATAEIAATGDNNVNSKTTTGTRTNNIPSRLPSTAPSVSPGTPNPNWATFRSQIANGSNGGDPAVGLPPRSRLSRRDRRKRVKKEQEKLNLPKPQPILLTPVERHKKRQEKRRKSKLKKAEAIKNASLERIVVNFQDNQNHSKKNRLSSVSKQAERSVNRTQEQMDPQPETSAGDAVPAEASQPRQPQTDFVANTDFIRLESSDDEVEITNNEPTRNHNSSKPNQHNDHSRGQKRKFGNRQGVTEEESNEVRKKKGEIITPWFDGLQWKERDVQEMLTAEIGSFVAYIKPTYEEDRLRWMIIEMIRKSVQTRWPDADVEPFGSFGTKLYLPGGDIDLVILSSRMMKEKPSKILYMLAPIIREKNIGQEVVVIAKAKVPIIKFRTIFGNFNVDISINQSNGLVALKKVNELLNDIKALSLDIQERNHRSTKNKTHDPNEQEIMNVVNELGSAKCLILVIKSVLKQRGMNEVYSGGLGSYSIVCLVVSFLQLHPKIQRGDIDPNKNLGVLLLEFFELYGRHYNFDVRQGGYYFSKSRRGWTRERQPYLLSIEDPADETNDIAGGSHKILVVRSVFSGAFDLLSATLYHRHSLKTSREAASDSSSKHNYRPLLSVPVPNRVQDDEQALLDPMAQSLLGEIMGVTKELEDNRKKNMKLYYSGTLQRMLGLSPPASPRNEAKAKSRRNISVQQGKSVEAKQKDRQSRRTDESRRPKGSERSESDHQGRPHNLKANQSSGHSDQGRHDRMPKDRDPRKRKGKAKASDPDGVALWKEDLEPTEVEFLNNLRAQEASKAEYSIHTNESSFAINTILSKSPVSSTRSDRNFGQHQDEMESDSRYNMFSSRKSGEPFSSADYLTMNIKPDSPKRGERGSTIENRMKESFYVEDESDDGSSSIDIVQRISNQRSNHADETTVVEVSDEKEEGEIDEDEIIEAKIVAREIKKVERVPNEDHNDEQSYPLISEVSLAEIGTPPGSPNCIIHNNIKNHESKKSSKRFNELKHEMIEEEVQEDICNEHQMNKSDLNRLSNEERQKMWLSKAQTNLIDANDLNV